MVAPNKRYRSRNIAKNNRFYTPHRFRLILEPSAAAPGFFSFLARLCVGRTPSMLKKLLIYDCEKAKKAKINRELIGFIHEKSTHKLDFEIKICIFMNGSRRSGSPLHRQRRLLISKKLFRG